MQKKMKNIKTTARTTRTVYKLLDSKKMVLHVGETGQDLRARLYQHQHRKFPNAESIVLLESNRWTRSESYQAQLVWQEKYGMGKDNHGEGGKISGPKNAKKDIVCECCGGTFPYMTAIRYHGKHCKTL